MRPFLWIMVLAFALRIVGIQFGLPQITHQDEPIVVNHALAYASFDFHPHFFKIPPLVSYLVFGVYGVLYLVQRIVSGTGVEEFAVGFFRDPTLFYLAARVLFGALLGAASVAVLYRLAEKTFGTITAWAASFFFAVNYLHVRDSHYIYADIPMIFAMLMVCLALTDAEWGIRRATVWAGIAVAFKYIAAPILLPVYAVAFSSSDRKKWTGQFFWISLLSFGVYVLLNPFSLIDVRFFLSEILTQAEAESASPFLHHIVYSLLGSCGVFLLALSFFGALLIVWRFKKRCWLLLFPIFYYLLLWQFSQPYERYVMPIVPFLCLFAGVFVEGMAPTLKNSRTKIAASTLLLLAAGAEPLTKSVHLDRILLREDTRVEARRWILEHVPDGAGIALQHPFFSPKIEQTPDQVRAKTGRITSVDPHRAEKEKKIAYLLRAQEGSKTYAVHYLTEHMSADATFLTWSPMIEQDVESLRRENIRYFVRYRQATESPFFEKMLSSKARLTAVFSPYKDPDKKFTLDDWSNTGLPFRSSELFSRTRSGPYLEIYEFDLK